MNTLKTYSWNDIDRDVSRLCLQIVKEPFNPDYIISISRGGNVLGTMISYRLDTRLVTFDPKFQELKDLKIDFRKNILFVDDINDTGNTINTFKINLVKHLKGNYNEGWEKIYTFDNVKYLTLYNNITSNASSHYFIYEINKLETPNLWIEFPWE